MYVDKVICSESADLRYIVIVKDVEQVFRNNLKVYDLKNIFNTPETEILFILYRM